MNELNIAVSEGGEESFVLGSLWLHLHLTPVGVFPPPGGHPRARPESGRGKEGSPVDVGSGWGGGARADRGGLLGPGV